VEQDLWRLFRAQAVSRHLDLAQRWLQARGEGFYTIGSAGHESNAAVALATRPSDPALLHYRSGGFYAARAAQVEGSSPIDDVLQGSTAATDDVISGGRHKVFGNPALSIIPQTSTIGSHAPRAFGLAFTLGHTPELVSAFPDDAVVVCSVGDASINHSTTVGALNAASYCAHRGVHVPLLLVCEDNGIGISTQSPAGWVERRLTNLPAFDYYQVEGDDPVALLSTCRLAAEGVRSRRAPAVLHLKTVRFMGHAGSDAEIAYRSRRDILADYDRDPLLATGRALVERGAATTHELLERYEEARTSVMDRARAMVGRVKRLASADEVMRPLTERRVARVSELAATAGNHVALTTPSVSGSSRPLTLAQAIGSTLHEALEAWPQAQVFGEDVARKGGVYGVTRGLRKTFGPKRVFDTLLDEQTIIGTALGAALAGLVPIPEIQYLAYLHNAEDQLRGEAASLRFFSAGQYENGMVLRVAGLAYQKGFGGHFHNDNSLAVLRDVPGLVCAIPSSARSAPGLLRECLALAIGEGRVCVYVEPIALYHERDLYEDSDELLLAPFPRAGARDTDVCSLGQVSAIESGRDVLLLTFGNGVRMSRRAARTLAREGISCGVVDLQWVAPLPVDSMLAVADRYPSVLVVDETRDSGGVGEGIISALVRGGYSGHLDRVCSRDSYVPLGPAADHVLLSETDVIDSAISLVNRRLHDGTAR
jgi:2-oxoisovalerate dehydrogenase E1 component